MKERITGYLVEVLPDYEPPSVVSSHEYFEEALQALNKQHRKHPESACRIIIELAYYPNDSEL